MLSGVIPERTLWAAVFLQAYAEALGFRSYGIDRRRAKIDAHRWIFSDRSEVGSFEWIADILSIDASAVRCRLRDSRAPELRRHGRFSRGLGDRPHRVRVYDPAHSQLENRPC